MHDKTVLAKIEKADIEELKRIISMYVSSLHINLSFQDIDRELEDFPKKYDEPEGAFVVAKVNGMTCGCVGLRKIGQGICEMKRLYVLDEFKGRGIGRRLVQRIVEEGRVKGYAKMRLDTLRDMKPALALYRASGFYEIGPYTYNPIEGAVYMEIDLENRSPREAHA
ncbi:MAG: GNAT family N-acetyltransferase [Spirochaetota bacterium]